MYGFARLFTQQDFSYHSHKLPLYGTLAGGSDKTRKNYRQFTQMPKWKYETVLGWFVHYVMGTVMISAFLMPIGKEWIDEPRLLPVMISVLIFFPFCMLQPSFGFGFFGSKTRNPKVTRKRVLVAYVGFGAGIYFSGWLLHCLQYCL